MTTVYGIPNCDTVKKARRWLKDHSIDYSFHDYKKEGIDSNTLKAWCDTFGYETLLNTRGSTWRKLDEKDRANVTEASAIKLMMEHTSLIKRPVIVSGRHRIIGYDTAAYESLL